MQLIGPAFTYAFFKYVSPYPPLPTSQDSVLWFFWSYFVNSFFYEILFYWGHYFEHLVPAWYRDYHLLHHTTKADYGLSGFYMTFVDYIFEGLLPMCFAVVISAFMGLSSVSVMTTVMLAKVYAITVHSGWQVPGFPDPGNHWLHHTKVAPRGQGINYGTQFLLWDPLMNTYECYDLVK